MKKKYYYIIFKIFKSINNKKKPEFKIENIIFFESIQSIFHD